jgi:acyl-CoA synthetase (AMP-forming)/AMP-acid ligase II
VQPRAGQESGTAAEALPPRRPSARDHVDAAIKAANRRLGIHQRVVAWRLWPEDSVPMTHTLKVRRSEVRAWARGERG